MDIPRKPPESEREEMIKARQDLAGRFGFILGCLAAVVAVTLNILRAPRPMSFVSLAMAVLMAALNMPIGIMLGLLGEKATRPKNLR